MKMSKNEIDKNTNRPTSFYAVPIALLAVSIFASGWLFGSGRLSLRSQGLIPSVARSESIPDSGLNELYSEIVSNYDGEISEDQVLDGLKEGLAEAVGDPFTEYLSEEETKEFNEGLNGTFEGIGAELGREGEFVVIVSPIKGAPAEKAGLQPKDVILEIDGESATGISISDAVSRIRGPKGEQVALVLSREGERVEVSIIRDMITINSVEWRVEGDIGIMSLSRFGDDTTMLVRRAATEFKDKKVSKVVLDLRNNPGGLLTGAVDVSSVWLPIGSTILEEKQNGVIVKTYRSEQSPILKDVKTVVLINEGSASASEIVAGALRDNKAATIIGEKSYGKGSVQRVIPLSFGGSLKVTIARWFTPSGATIDKEGIVPDTEVLLTTEDREAGRDPQLDAALRL